MLGTAAIRYLRRSPDSGGWWSDHTPRRRTIANVRVVRNVAVHRAVLRRLFRGNLCVTQRGLSMRSLETIQRRVVRDARPQLLRAAVHVVDSHVDVDAILDEGARQRVADARYGRGIVRIRSALLRVSPTTTGTG